MLLRLRRGKRKQIDEVEKRNGAVPVYGLGSSQNNVKSNQGQTFEAMSKP